MRELNVKRGHNPRYSRVFEVVDNVKEQEKSSIYERHMFGLVSIYLIETHTQRGRKNGWKMRTEVTGNVSRADDEKMKEVIDEVNKIKRIVTGREVDERRSKVKEGVKNV